MKNFYIAIGLALLTGFNANARLVSVTNLNEAKQNASIMQAKVQKAPERTPYELSPQEKEEYIKDRIKFVNLETLDNADQSLDGGALTSVVESEAEAQAAKEQAKGTFEKIYDRAMARISNTPQTQGSIADDETYFVVEQTPQEPQNAYSADTLGIYIDRLGQTIAAPAMEHIPYMFVNINLLPEGLLEVEERIIVVADKNKLKYGLVRSLPAYSISRNKEKTAVDFSLLGVSINGQAANYRAKRVLNNIIIAPAVQAELPSGVYEYKFSYVADRVLNRYENFNELYWNATNNASNLLIARFGININLPAETAFISKGALLGRLNQVSTQSVAEVDVGANSAGFVALRPLLAGESVYMVANFNKSNILEPTFSKNMLWHITDYGAFLSALLGSIAIVAAYLFSWRGIKKNDISGIVTLPQNGAMLRYLLNQKFDPVCFGACLLELFRKKAIDFNCTATSACILKKAENTKFLSWGEKLFLQILFGKNSRSFEMTPENKRKSDKAYKILQTEIKSKFGWFKLKLNGNYLLFGCAMLLISELAVSAFGIDSKQIFIVLIMANILWAALGIAFLTSFRHKAVQYAIKILAAGLFLFSIAVTAAFVSYPTAILLAAGVISIVYFSKLFSGQNGLIKPYTIAAEEQKSRLINSAASLSLGSEALQYQAQAYAYNIEGLVVKTDSNKEYYRLDAVAQIVSKL